MRVFREPLNWDDIVVGQVYTFEDKYHTQLDVLVRSISKDDEFINIEVEVLESYRGTAEKGDIMNMGKTLNPTASHYASSMKFFPENSMFSYTNGWE